MNKRSGGLSSSQTRQKETPSKAEQKGGRRRVVVRVPSSPAGPHTKRAPPPGSPATGEDLPPAFPRGGARRVPALIQLAARGPSGPMRKKLSQAPGDSSGMQAAGAHGTFPSNFPAFRTAWTENINAPAWAAHARGRFDPRSGRSPGEGNGNPLQCSCLEKSTDREAWRAPVPGAAEWDLTECTPKWVGKMLPRKIQASESGPLRSLWKGKWPPFWGQVGSFLHV